MNKFFKVGHNIKSLREQFNITQQELANRINQTGYDLDITQAYISALEKSRGEKLPSVPVLVALAEVFETSTDAILGLNPVEKINPLTGLARPDQIMLMLFARRLSGRESLRSWPDISDYATLADDIGLDEETIEHNLQVALEPTA